MASLAQKQLQYGCDRVATRKEPKKCAKHLADILCRIHTTIVLGICRNNATQLNTREKCTRQMAEVDWISLDQPVTILQPGATQTITCSMRSVRRVQNRTPNIGVLLFQSKQRAARSSSRKPRVVRSQEA